MSCCHDHDLDYAGKYHRHDGLEDADAKASRRITALQDEVGELRGQLRNALTRIDGLDRLRPTCTVCLDAAADRQTSRGPACSDCAGEPGGAPGPGQTECGPCIREDECACLTEPGLEPYCGTCGEEIGIFYGHGASWHHWRNDDAGRTRIYDAGHAATVVWREAGVT